MATQKQAFLIAPLVIITLIITAPRPSSGESWSPVVSRCQKGQKNIGA